MAPKIADMATITITRETRQGLYDALSVVGEAMQAMARAIVDSVSTAFQALARAVSTPTAPRVHSYPGVDMRFSHRGARRR
jgi:hypothetical protein